MRAAVMVTGIGQIENFIFWNYPVKPVAMAMFHFIHPEPGSWMFLYQSLLAWIHHCLSPAEVLVYKSANPAFLPVRKPVIKTLLTSTGNSTKSCTMYSTGILSWYHDQLLFSSIFLNNMPFIPTSGLT
jgi:hypothetical protein